MLVLASSSPRRRDLIRYLELPFVVDPSSVDETSVSAGSPEALALTLAELKARDVATRHPEAVVIGADTLVDLQGQVLNKPADAAEALRMLTLLSGNVHRVHTGIAIRFGDKSLSTTVSSRVHMRLWTVERLRAYVATGEPLDKAGAYAAQGEGAALIERVEGSFLAVVGLPLAALRALLAEVGVVSPVPRTLIDALELGIPAE